MIGTIGVLSIMHAEMPVPEPRIKKVINDSSKKVVVQSGKVRKRLGVTYRAEFDPGENMDTNMIIPYAGYKHGSPGVNHLAISVGKRRYKISFGISHEVGMPKGAHTFIMERKISRKFIPINGTGSAGFGNKTLFIGKNGEIELRI